MLVQILLVMYHSLADGLWLSKFKINLIYKINDLMDIRWIQKYYYTHSIDASGQETQSAVFNMRKNRQSRRIHVSVNRLRQT